MKSAITSTALLLAIAAPAAAQNNDFANVEIRTEQLAPGIAVLFGAGGNIGVSYGDDETVLIDDQFAPLTDRIVAAVAALDPDPVELLINTHWHGDHSGGNENFGESGALIFAQDNVRTRLSTQQGGQFADTPPSPAVALPVVTYENGLKLHLNGDTLHIIHMPHGHTDGDSIIWWEQANVVHMGDLFFNKISLPFIDRESGGSAQGMLAAAEHVLAMTNDDTRIIPGHGPMANRADLVAYRNMLATVVERVQTAIDAGKSLEQVRAMGLADEFAVPDAFIDAPTFTGFVYDSLTDPEMMNGGYAHDAHGDHDHTMHDHDADGADHGHED